MRSSLSVSQNGNQESELKRGGAEIFFFFTFPVLPGGEKGPLVSWPEEDLLQSTTFAAVNYSLMGTHFSSTKVGEEMTAPRVRKQPSSPDECSSTAESKFGGCSGVREKKFIHVTKVV